MNDTLDCRRQDEGRGIAEVLELPGLMAHGACRDEAILKGETPAPRAIAERLETADAKPTVIPIARRAAA